MLGPTSWPATRTCTRVLASLDQSAARIPALSRALSRCRSSSNQGREKHYLEVRPRGSRDSRQNRLSLRSKRHRWVHREPFLEEPSHLPPQQGSGASRTQHPAVLHRLCIRRRNHTIMKFENASVSSSSSSSSSSKTPFLCRETQVLRESPYPGHQGCHRPMPLAPQSPQIGIISSKLLPSFRRCPYLTRRGLSPTAETCQRCSR